MVIKLQFNESLKFIKKWLKKVSFGVDSSNSDLNMRISKERRVLFLRRWPIVLWVMTVPLVGMFYFIDLIYCPNVSNKTIIARLAVFPVAFASQFLFRYKIIKNKYYFVPSLMVTLYLTSYSCYLVSLTGFEESHYYAGLNLIALGSLTFLPWSLKLAIIQIAISFVPYFILIILKNGPILWNYMVPNTAFLISTIFLGLINYFDFSASRFKEVKVRNSLFKLNISKQKVIEEKDKMQADLVQSEKLASIGTLAAGVAHEINNSLNGIAGLRGPLEIVVESLPDSPSKLKLVKIIKAQSKSVDVTLDIINSLMNFAGANRSKFKKLSVSEIIHSVTVIINNKIVESRVQVVLDFSNDLTIFGNSVNLHQVFMNLIINACDAMINGGKVTIQGKMTDDGTELKVIDSGSGISSEIIGRIFDPFFTTKDVGKGTGLGLHIVRNVINEHKGKISIESELGKGTTFIIFFPHQKTGDFEK